MSAPRVLIVGAGIGGLTIAITLRRLGVSVDVVERAPSFGPIGAGITIQPNAVAVLDALGVELPPSDVYPIGFVAMLDRRGRPLVAGNPLTDEVPFPAFNIRRPELHRVLLGALEGASLELGREVEGVRELEDRSVEVEFADGARGRWDLVIGADGIHSAVRRALLGARSSTTRYAGQTCWRFVLEAPELVPEVTIERWSPGRRVGVVPLSRGGIYVYIVESAPPGSPGEGSADLARLHARFADIDERLATILEQLASLGEGEVHVHHGDLEDQPELSFGRGRILLLGDAAHAMTPNMGQGAAMAIEDAAALGLLWDTVSLDELVAGIAEQRRPRVEQIHRRSWQIGQVAHWTGALRCGVRDLLLRCIPARVSQRGIRETWAPGVELGQRLRARLVGPQPA